MKNIPHHDSWAAVPTDSDLTFTLLPHWFEMLASPLKAMNLGANQIHSYFLQIELLRI